MEGLIPEDDCRKFDILQWWKSNGTKFPTLAKLARDVLAVPISRDVLVVPISSVASESAFSVGGKIIIESRSCFGEDSVEALVCSTD